MTVNKYNLLATRSVLALDNQVDTRSGTVKTQLTDSDAVLFPSKFVKTRLKEDTLMQVSVVPTRANQHGSKGKFVFVVANPIPSFLETSKTARP